MSTILKSYKFRIYPNQEQCNRFAQAFGAARWIFNHFLNENNRRYENGEKHLSGFDCNKIITQLKKESETSWLKEIDDWVLKNSSSNLDQAFKNFFTSVTGKRKGPKVKNSSSNLDQAFKNFFTSVTGKRKGPKVSYPKFKSKGRSDSFRTTCKLDQESGYVKIPKISAIKCVFDREIVGKVKTVTISKQSSGKYFVSILVEEDQKLLPMTGLEVGIDLGLKDLIILDNGAKFWHPDEIPGYVKAKRNLKKQQRKLAKKTKGSNSFDIQRIKVAKAYEKLTNIKKDYYHNLSRWLVNSFDAIYLENLNVKGMLKNHKLARKIHDASWSTLVSMIGYKAGWAGKTFHQIGRFVPSSKTCSCCGYKKQDLTLGDRFWICPSCGEHHDRDINAAQNIKNFGQIDCYGQVVPSVAMTESGASLPMGLQKFATKIERSDCKSGRLAKGATKPKNL